MWKRYIIELGWGADLHGQDVTKAARRAVEDAIRKSCLCGLVEVLGITDFDQVRVHVTIACPNPEAVNEPQVLSVLPEGKKSMEVTKGGDDSLRPACAGLWRQGQQCGNRQCLCGSIGVSGLT